MEKNTIGKFIAALRKASGMTQKELGEKLYVSDKTVSRWERDECTPELDLIPAIAEIFSITTDELLRGQRRTDSADTPDGAARLRARADKQWRSLLQRCCKRYTNLSYIARGVALMGLIAAIVCDLCFTRALLGFCLGLVFLLSAGIMELCFVSSFRLFPDPDEPERHDDIRRTNALFTRTAVSVFTLIGAVLAFLLPLLISGAYYGLGADSWIVLGLACMGAALLVGHLLYTFILRRHFIRRGWLTEEDAQQTVRDRQLLGRLGKICLPVAAVLAAAIFALNLCGTTWLAKAEEFDNYDDFEAFMAEEAAESYRRDWLEQGFTVIPHPQGYLVKDTDGELVDSILFSTDTVTDAEGRVLSTYVSDGASRIRFAFDASPDGLPVQVYTFEAMSRAYRLQQLIVSVLLFAIALTFAIGALAYLVQRRRDN